MTTKKQPKIELKITSQEIRNICEQYAFNEDTKLKDTDESYAVKKAMSKLDKSDFIIYCLFLELETKTAVAEVLGLSRISTTRIIKQIENHIKEIVRNDGFVIGDTDNSLHN